MNPSVVRVGGRYLNLYSGFDGKTWHTGTAESADGLQWTKRQRVLSPSGWEGQYIAANGSVIEFNGELLYWYQAGDPPRIALARSHDSLSWLKHGEAVLPLGPPGSFDERAVADPCVMRRGEFFFLFYLGQDRARQQKLGLARSRDGVVWEKSRANPILDLGRDGAFDENGLGEPAVWSSGGSFWMLYTGRDRHEYRRIGLARSADGVKWVREENFQPLEGAEDWDRAVMCDPSVEVMPEGIRVWFGGGDVPSPDQGLHGQIGFGLLR